MQQTRQISSLLTKADIGNPLNAYTLLPSDNRIIPVYLDLMQRYNLLPNDALIIATAKLHQITAIASYDPDFASACTGETIRLIREITDLA